MKKFLLLGITLMLSTISSNVFATVSSHGLEIIKKFEGLKLVEYIEPASGKAHIGYGHLIRKGEFFPYQISETRAELLLRKDVARYERAVHRYVKVPLTTYQYDALVSLAFNIGQYGFRDSTLVRKLNQGDYEGASKEFSRWVYSRKKVVPGLVKRRAIEQKLFNTRCNHAIRTTYYARHNPDRRHFKNLGNVNGKQKVATSDNDGGRWYKVAGYKCSSKLQEQRVSVDSSNNRIDNNLLSLHRTATGSNLHPGSTYLNRLYRDRARLPVLYRRSGSREMGGGS